MLLKEILASLNNINSFKKKYGTNLSDADIENIFSRFNAQQSRLKIKDIFGYNSIEDLYSVINKKSNKEVNKDIADVNIMFNTKDILIVEPLNTAAAQKYGNGTKWCTASKKDNEFDGHFSPNTLLVYFIFKKHPDKYSIYWHLNDGVVDGYDDEDGEYDPQDILNIFGVSEDDIFKKSLTPEARQAIISARQK